MPTSPQVRVPRFVVALMLVGLFIAALAGLRHYATWGDSHALTLAIAAGVLCLLTAAGLIHANYEPYHRRSNGRLNGSP